MRTKAMPKPLLFIFFCILVVGCQPSPEVVGSKVQALLQEKLDATFGNSDVKVANVVAVREAKNKYQGVANITAFSAPINLKLTILADSKNVIYETTALDWAAFVSAVNQQKSKAVEGQYSDVAVANSAVFSCFPDILRRDKAKFAERLATVAPVKLEANFWFGSGCKTHECGSEEAAWAIDGDRAEGYAIILTTSVAGPTFLIYGGEPDELPPPLLSWALENGMNGFNSVVIRPEQKARK